jgi:hypothetical protein
MISRMIVNPGFSDRREFSVGTSNSIFLACPVDLCRSLARAEPEERLAVRLEPCWSIALEIHRRRIICGLRCICTEPAAARYGLSSLQSDASYASRRIAANLRLIVDGAYECCSSAIR